MASGQRLTSLQKFVILLCIVFAIVLSETYYSEKK